MSDPHRPPPPNAGDPPGPQTESLPPTASHLADEDRTAGTPADRSSPRPPPSVTLPEQTGRYAILGEIARGGMGAVLLARDEEMDRQLAIKVLFDGFDQRPESVRRFLEEARVGGRLQHPGIVPIYDLGRFADERPYFTMKLVQGRTLSALLDERGDAAANLPRLLTVFEHVCQTIAYAHARGVIHRDLKPSNVMVGEFGEVQVMDWGVAKVLRAPAAAGGAPSGEPLTPRAEDPQATEAGAVLGTLQYMAPEQARGEIDSLDERCDVFGLGGMLCAILTGQPPYGGQRSGAQERAVRGDLGDAFARLDGCGADPELIALAKSCLAPERADRPRDAGAVARSMTAYLAGVQERLKGAEIASAAAQARAAEARAKAAAERRSRRLTLGLAVVLLLGASLAGGAWIWLQARAAETTAAVNQALLEATGLHERARAADGDLLKWAEAVGAMKKAQALAAGGHADDALRERVETALASVVAEEAKAQQRVREAERHRRMLARFDEIRLRMSDVYGEGPKAFAGAARDCRQVLKENGLDVDVLDPKEAVARIRALPGPIAQAVVAAVDDYVFAEWADYWTTRERRFPKSSKSDAMMLLVLGGDPVLTKNLKVWRRRLGIAQGADTDPLRKQLRDAINQLAIARFKKLVAADDVATLAAPTVRIMGEMLYSLGEVDRATDLMRRAQQRGHGGDFWINYRLAFYAAQRRPPAWDDTVRYATAAVALRPGCVEGLRLLGFALERQNDIDAALAAYRQLLRASPKDALAHSRIGSLFYKKGDNKESAVWDQKAVDLRPNDAIFQANLGLALWHTGALDRAAGAMREAVRLEPDNDQRLEWLGKILLQQRRFAEADAAFAKAAKLRPDAAQYHFRQGEARRRGGRLEEALAAFRSALKLEPGLTEARFDLAATLADLGKRDEAVAEYRELLRRTPEHAVAQNNLGVLLERKGELDAAIAAYREAVRLNPSDHILHTNLCRALDARGNLDGTVAAYRELLRRWPGDEDAHDRLTRALYRRGDGKRDRQVLLDALPLLKEDLRKAPSPAAAYPVGEALASLGNEGKGVAYLTDRKEPGTAPAAVVYTALLALNGKEAAYRTACAAVLERFGRTADAEEAFQAMRCLTQAPGAGTEPAEAVRLARQAVKAQPRSAPRLHALALAHCRAREFGEAVRQAQESLKADPAWSPALNWLVLALAHDGLGQADEARRWLRRAGEAGAVPPESSAEGLLYRLLRREAEGRLKDVPPRSK